MKKVIAEISYSKTASDNFDFGFTRTVILLHLVFAVFFSKAHKKVPAYNTETQRLLM